MRDLLPSSAVPQADRVERALEYALLLHYRQFALRDLLFRGRDAMHYRSAAQILGLIDAASQPTASVLDFVEASDEPLVLLRDSFERSAIGQAWARWSQTSLWSVEPASAAAFLANATELAPVTVARRAKTLRMWLKELLPKHSGPTIEELRGELLAQPLSNFYFSMRTTNVFRREGIEYVHQAVALTSVGLLGLRAFGQTLLREIDGLLSQAPPGEGIDELAAALRSGAVKWSEGVATPTQQAPTPTVDSNYDTILELWEARLSRLNQRDAQVILRRSGAVGEVETLEAISETLDLTRERVRQLEKRGLDRLRLDGSWKSRILTGLIALRKDAGYLWLTDLEDDPFFQPLVDRPEFVCFLVNRVLEADWFVYRWGREDLLLTHERKREPESVYNTVAQALRGASWPAPYAAFLDLVGGLLRSDETDLLAAFIERAHADLLLDDDENPSQVIQFGQSRDGRIVAFMNGCEGPVSIRELEQRFGRGPLPSACLFVRRGQAALPRHFPDFESWERRLVPLAMQIMERDGPDRQWMAHDLLDLAGEEGPLPEWITPWLLSSMLRRSGRVEDLRRQRFALKGTSPQARVHLLPAMIEILERAGGPISEELLRERLYERVEVLETTFVGLRTTVPLFPTGDGRLGLVTRDLPGGLAAVHAAGVHLEAVLRKRGRGLTFHLALNELHTLSPEHAQWSAPMVAVVGRARPTIIANRSGIGLNVWDDVRIPTQPEVLLNLLNEGEGVVRISAFVRTIQELHGREPARAQVASVAHHAGARLRGNFVVHADLADDFVPPILRAPGPPPAALALGHPDAAPPPRRFPSARKLQLPRAARELYAKLAQELPGDWKALLRRCEAHASRLSVQEARLLAQRLPELVKRVRASNDPLGLRLAWIAARYFELADDGALDFMNGGLDDSVAVFNAIAVHLGGTDLAFSPRHG